MESYNVHLSFVFLDFSSKNEYNCVMIKQKDNQYAPYFFDSSKFEISMFLSESFSTAIYFKFGSSIKKKESDVYYLNVFIYQSNYIYAFLNSNYKYHIELYAQINPKEAFYLFSKEITIRIFISKYIIAINFIDQYRCKGVVNLINFPLNFTFINPHIHYKINQADLNNKLSFKMCIYMLYNYTSKIKNYYITCHPLIESNTEQFSLLRSFPENYNIYFINMNQTVLDINSKIQLPIGKKDIQNMVILFNDIRNAFSSFIKNNLDSYYLSLVPIDKIPNMTRKCAKLFHSIYYFSFIIQGVVNVIGAIPINNKITTYMEILFEHICQCYQIFINNSGLLLHNKKELPNNLKRIAISYGVYKRQIESHDDIIEPIQVDLISLEKQQHFYSKGFALFKEVISSIREDLFLLEPLILLNSKISKEINVINKNTKNVFEICILDYNEVK